MNSILSIDIGTTEIKFGIYDDRGQAVNIFKMKTPLSTSAKGTVAVEPIYHAVLTGLKEIVSQTDTARDVEVIGIDGQMGGILGIDENWHPVFDFDPPINNNYKRYLLGFLTHHRTAFGDESGSIPINGSKIVYWVREEPEIFRKVAKILSLGGYVVGKLAGIEWDRACI
jgi:xylulokinase